MYAKNKKYEVYLNTTQDTMNEIKKISEQNAEELAQNFDIASIDFVDNHKLTKKLKDLIIETYKKEESKLTNESLITVYNYQDHDYQKINIPRFINPKLDEYILKDNTSKLKKIINKSKTMSYSIYDAKDFTNLDYYVFQYVINTHEREFLNYLEENNTKYTEDYMQIYIYGSYSMVLEIGDAKKFKETFDKYKIDLKDDLTYQNLVKSFEENNYDN